MNVAQILQTHTTTRPDTAAIIDTRRGRQRVLSFAGLDLASARAAALLRLAGLRSGQAVLVFQPMSAELYIALLAIFRLGLIAMFLDPAQGREHIEWCCALHRPQAFIGGPKAHWLRLLSPALRRIPHKFVIGRRVPGAVPWSRADALEPYADIHPCDDEIPALLTFTGGSTGRPKATLRTHGFLLAQHRALAQSLALTAGQTDLTTMPIVALANLASGVTCLIPAVDLRYPGAIEPAPVVEQLVAHRVTSTVASPALLERLARYCLDHDLTLDGLTKIFSGGAPVVPRLLDRLQQVAPQAEVVAVYGSTEAEPMANIARREISPQDRQAMLAGRGLPAGRPVETICLKVVSDQWGTPIGPYTGAEFSTQCCPPEMIGEIVVSGEHVLSGYLHGQGDEETKFRVGDVIWHRTGDAGYLDRAGRLWLMGRCAARLEDRHGRLYPFAVECALSDQANVRRSAVVSHQGRRLLVVEFEQAPDAGELAGIKQSLAWAHLAEIRVLKRIPVDKRHNAKIDYPALRRRLGWL
jgi:acyl-CoA synthetase (AMP-forming)/AMP-acid ligase II